MNRKKKKDRYIAIKNSWRWQLKDWGRIEITISSHSIFPHNPKHPRNMIIMDFKNRDDIVKYGFKNCMANKSY